jgi:hypothetical protein
MLVALLAMFIPLKTKRRPRQPGRHNQVGRTPLSVLVRRWTSLKIKGIAIDPLQGYEQEACQSLAPVGRAGRRRGAHHLGAPMPKNDALQRKTRAHGAGPQWLTHVSATIFEKPGTVVLAHEAVAKGGTRPSYYCKYDRRSRVGGNLYHLNS